MKLYKYCLVFYILILITSCSDHLDRTPLDSVTDLDYFHDPKDLKTYVNQYYTNGNFEGYNNWGNDFDSDNAVQKNINQKLEGTRTVSTSGSINFSKVRSINYFFDHYDKVQEENSIEDYQQYLGEAYFFKALIYFDLVKQYGDIQWYNHELEPDDSALKDSRTPRNVVVDSIIDNLDMAAKYLQEDKTNGAGRVNKWMALLMQSRIALYEGSWEKYHDGGPFGVSEADPDEYFQKAADAAEEVMNSGMYDLYSTGDPENDYKNLFSRQDYSGNPEVMFWKKYDNELGKGERVFTNDRNFRMEKPVSHTITKQLADAYLTKDGKPVAVSTAFKGHDNLKNEAKNRDPRFSQTIALPDEIRKITSDGEQSYWNEVYNKLNTAGDYNAPTGYLIQKGYNPNMEFHVEQYEETPHIIYRYAEVLLNYVEAKAELDDINQSDIDETINRLRDRVGMTPLNMSAIETDPDWNFPNLSPLINEIRRERRVELALEGFRWDDIARWAAANELIIGQKPKGFKADQIEENPFPVDAEGFLEPFQGKIPDGYGFVEDRDYLNSIPETELELNDNLEQNPGW